MIIYYIKKIIKLLDEKVDLNHVTCLCCWDKGERKQFS